MQINLRLIFFIAVVFMTGYYIGVVTTPYELRRLAKSPLY